MCRYAHLLIVIAKPAMAVAVALNQSAFALTLRFLGEPCMGAVTKIKILTAPYNLNRFVNCHCEARKGCGNLNRYQRRNTICLKPSKCPTVKLNI